MVTFRIFIFFFGSVSAFFKPFVPSNKKKKYLGQFRSAGVPPYHSAKVQSVFFLRFALPWPKGQKNLLMGLPLIGCFLELEFQEENGSLKHSGKRLVEVGNGPLRRGSAPLRLMGCFRAPYFTGVLRGNTIRGNTTPSSENGTLRGSLRGPLKNL